MPITNAVITTGGVAQDIVPALMNRQYIEINAVSEDTWVNFGTNAALNVGELVLVGQTKSWLRWHRPEIQLRVSIFCATTGSRVIAGYDQGS